MADRERLDKAGEEFVKIGQASYQLGFWGQDGRLHMGDIGVKRIDEKTVNITMSESDPQYNGYLEETWGRNLRRALVECAAQIVNHDAKQSINIRSIDMPFCDEQ